jgi:hypothetical protein
MPTNPAPDPNKQPDPYAHAPPDCHPDRQTNPIGRLLALAVCGLEPPAREAFISSGKLRQFPPVRPIARSVATIADRTPPLPPPPPPPPPQKPKPAPYAKRTAKTSGGAKKAGGADAKSA